MAITAEDLNRRAVALLRQGQLEQAKIHLQKALELQPNNAEIHTNLGNVFIYQQRYDEAIAEYQKALRIRPDLFAAQYILAIALHDKGKLHEAEDHYRQALRLDPAHAEAHYSLGITLMVLGRVAEAIVCYRQALRLNPSFAEACNNLGNALGQQDLLDEAIRYYERGLALKPQSAEIHFNLGIARQRQKKLDEAIHCYRQALRLKPDYAGASMNLGNALSAQNKNAEAIQCYRRVLELRPGDAEALTNLGNVHRDQGCFDEALAFFEQALRQDATRAVPHHNRALLWLLLGNWSQGWPEYEWRLETDGFQHLALQQLHWDGSPLAGRTILLLAEQGLGDTLQFLRFVPLVQQRGGRVILQSQAPLHQLLTHCAPKLQVIVPGAPLPGFDVYAPLMSLPGVLGITPTSVPAEVPYLHADPPLVLSWRQKLQALGGFRIGIAWQGNPANRFDQQRSIPLAQFAPLAQLEGVRLVSLQKGPGMDQLHALADRFPVVDLGNCLDEAAGAFMDTAAIMKNLDLVISSDTAIAHLAGALAVPVWVALPLIPDWRWLLERQDSPWYPTLRLFRQTQSGRWDDVFARMAEELKSELVKRVL
jgi:tetratricopeptide (TPR) repeat protein